MATNNGPGFSLDLFQKVKQRGDSYTACCPAHDDKNPSLSIKKTADRWLLKCHAGCETESILQAVGLEFSDLQLGNFDYGPKHEIEYKYHDEAGTHVYSAIRIPQPGGKKKFFQKQANGKASMKGVTRYPYRLSEVLKSDTVFIVEGEKDVETLRSHKLVATCNVGGAGKWLDTYKRYFDGKTVYILPDNDEAGRNHAADVVEKLGHGIVVELPVGHKQDVSDWFESGGTVDELLRLAQAASPQPEKQICERASKLIADYLKRLSSKAVPQLYKQHEALDGLEVGPGLVTVLGAPPGAGKTALALQILFDALELTEGLSAVYAGSDTSFDTLIRRQLVRMTRIPSRRIRFAELDDEEMEQVSESALELMKRMEHVKIITESSLAHLASLKNIEPGFLIVDYLQQFAPSDKEVRIATGEVMKTLRALANIGWGVLAISATKRDSQGKHEQKELGLSSFRESSEVEYNANSAYVLVDKGQLEEDYISHILLKHVKNREGLMQDRELRFHKPRMEFTQFEPPELSEFESFAGSVFGGGDDE